MTEPLRLNASAITHASWLWATNGPNQTGWLGLSDAEKEPWIARARQELLAAQEV